MHPVVIFFVRQNLFTQFSIESSWLIRAIGDVIYLMWHFPQKTRETKNDFDSEQQINMRLAVYIEIASTSKIWDNNLTELRYTRFSCVNIFVWRNFECFKCFKYTKTCEEIVKFDPHFGWFEYYQAFAALKCEIPNSFFLILKRLEHHEATLSEVCLKNVSMLWLTGLLCIYSELFTRK